MKLLLCSRLLTKVATPTWEGILQRFPAQLQAEILNERPEGGQEDVQELQNWRLINPQPVSVPLKTLLQKEENRHLISLTSQEAVDKINEKWGTSFELAPVRYDKRPERYKDYANLAGATAAPSVLVNGEVYWGVGRFIAALMRGDTTLKVWSIKK